MRLSSTSAVLPAPDGPATAVSRFTGKLGGEVVQVVEVGDLDGELTVVAVTPGPIRETPGAPARNGPMIERGSDSSWPGVPAAITWPPCAPAAGPSSMTQSAERMMSRSCSTTITELPFPASAASILRRPVTLLGCSPTDGSSST